MNHLNKPLSLSFVVLLAFSMSARADRHHTLRLADAKAAVAAATAHADKRAGTGAITVVDAGGNVILVERLDGTFAASGPISIGKARTAALFGKPTKAFEDAINNGRTAMTALPDFTPLQGGVPIIIQGRVVGAVGVSGAASAQEDEDIAHAAVAAAISAAASAAPHAAQK